MAATGASQDDSTAYAAFCDIADQSFIAQASSNVDPLVAVTVSCALDRRCYPGALRPGPTAAPSSAAGSGASGLRLLFDFYARLQSPSTKVGKRCPTYDEIRAANETLSLFELMWMLRDTQVLPSRVSKSELQHLWTLTAPSRGRATTAAGRAAMAGLRFSEFPAFLAKLAVVTFAKPGLQRELTDIAQGAVPGPQHACEGLSRAMGLRRVRRVRHLLRTTGRATAGRMNFRSRGERNGESGGMLLRERALEMERKLCDARAEGEAAAEDGGGVAPRRFSRLAESSESSSDDDAYEPGARADRQPFPPRADVKRDARGSAGVDASRRVRRAAKGEKGRTGAARGGGLRDAQVRALDCFLSRGCRGSDGKLAALAFGAADPATGAPEGVTCWSTFPSLAMDLGCLFQDRPYRYRATCVSFASDLVDVAVRLEGAIGSAATATCAPGPLAPGMELRIAVEVRGSSLPVGEHSGTLELLFSSRRGEGGGAVRSVALPMHCFVLRDAQELSTLLRNRTPCAQPSPVASAAVAQDLSSSDGEERPTAAGAAPAARLPRGFSPACFRGERPLTYRNGMKVWSARGRCQGRSRGASGTMVLRTSRERARTAEDRRQLASASRRCRGQPAAVTAQGAPQGVLLSEDDKETAAAATTLPRLARLPRLPRLPQPLLPSGGGSGDAQTVWLRRKSIPTEAMTWAPTGMGGEEDAAPEIPCGDEGGQGSESSEEEDQPRQRELFSGVRLLRDGSICTEEFVARRRAEKGAPGGAADASRARGVVPAAGLAIGAAKGCA